MIFTNKFVNSLINAKNTHQTLDEVDARSLIYQKYLLSEDVESKLEYLFLLEELFKKNKLQKVYAKFLSEKLKEIGLENIPENYQEIAQNRITSFEELKLGKVKYNDKVLHQSRIIRFYVEKESGKKIQKEIDKILKKLRKIENIFIQQKTLH